MSSKKIQGSLTVEAVFVMPVVFTVIYCLMYISLILHDKVVLQSVTEEALVRCNQLCHQPSDVLTSEIHYSRLLDVSLLGESEEKHQQELSYYIKQELSGKLYICEVRNIDIVLDDDSCQITIDAHSRISLPLVGKMLGNNQSVAVAEQRDFHNPQQFARVAENVLGTVTQIKGADKVTSFLEKVNGYLGKE